MHEKRGNCEHALFKFNFWWKYVINASFGWTEQLPLDQKLRSPWSLFIVFFCFFFLLVGSYESRGGSSDFWLLTSNFRLPTSDFRLQTSDFRLKTSYFKLQTSDLTKCELRISDFWPLRLKAEWLDLRTSHFPFPTSDFPLPTSDFWLPTSDFPLLISNFRLLTSNFWVLTSDF